MVNIANVPTLGVPMPVAQALEEAAALRDRLQAAREAAAHAQDAVDQLEREDVAKAAAKARSGATSLGAPLPALAKVRATLDEARRIESALALAVEGATDDLASAITTNGDTWILVLAEQVEQARQRGLEAVDKVVQAAAEIGAAAAAAAWVRSGRADNRWDRPVAAMQIGSVAPSSARRTGNGEPLALAELVQYVSELFEPPAPKPPVTLGAPSALTNAD